MNLSSKCKNWTTEYTLTVCISKYVYVYYHSSYTANVKDVNCLVRL